MEKQIFQVVCVVRNLERTLSNWKRLVDFNQNSLKDASRENRCIYRGQEVCVPVKAVRFDLGGIDMKLVEPLNEQGDPYSDCLRTRGQGFHHLGIYTDDQSDMLERCRKIQLPIYEEFTEDGHYQMFDLAESVGFAFIPWDHMTGPCAPRDPQGRTI